MGDRVISLHKLGRNYFPSCYRVILTAKKKRRLSRWARGAYVSALKINTAILDATH